MTFKVNFIERHSGQSPRIERVFGNVAECLNDRGIETFFDKLPYGDGVTNVFRNLAEFRPKTADIYHVTGHATYIGLVLPRDNTVLTFHDTTILSLRRGPRREVLRKLYYQWPALRAARVTAISDATADSLSKIAGLERSSIRVIDNPCPIRPTHNGRQFNTAKPRILQIGTAANKNVPNLLRGVNGLNCVVHIVGPMTDDVERELRSNSIQFEHSASLNDEEMVRAYEEADIAAFCSTIEGFGLPIIEAQAFGLPVVTSNISPMREVAGDGALKVDPADPLAIRDAIKSLVMDPELRSRLTGFGRTNAARFEPERIAIEYEALYREILESAT